MSRQKWVLILGLVLVAGASIACRAPATPAPAVGLLPVLPADTGTPPAAPPPAASTATPPPASPKFPATLPPPTSTSVPPTRTPHPPARTIAPPAQTGKGPVIVNGMEWAAGYDHGPSGATSWILTDTLPSTADLAIRLLEPIQVVPGETTAYTLTIHNRGPAPATGIVLTNGLPKGVMPVWTQPAQPWCGRQGRTVSCAVGDLRAGDTTTITLDLSVGGTQTLITNTQLAGVTLDLSAPNCTIDSTQFSVTCRLTRLPAGADAQVRIGASVDARITGTLSNTATVTANETDPNPSNNRATLTMTVSAAAPVTDTPVPLTTDLVVHADGPSSVIAGQPFTYTYTITNRGELDATGVHFEDVLPPTANLYAFSPSPPLCEQRGDVLACSLRDPDTGKIITLTLVITGHAGQPMQISLDPLTPGWPICSVLKERTWLHIVNCELGTLKRGQTIPVQVGLVAVGVQERMMTNTVSASANEADLNSRDNTITATIGVQVRADLSVRSAISGPAIAGKPLSYTLTVANMGPSDADGVVVTDTLPMSTRLVSAVPSQGDDCRIEPKNAMTGTVICRLGQLSGGETATVTIVLAVDESFTPALPKTISHFAKVVSEQADPNLGNNELKEAIPVSAGTKD
jgi:uncharacterized repeat protein (TIGR01451 family)